MKRVRAVLTNLYQQLAIGLYLAILGIILLAVLGKPVPEALPMVASGAIGALAMAARPNGGGESASAPLLSHTPVTAQSRTTKEPSDADGPDNSTAEGA